LGHRVYRKPTQKTSCSCKESGMLVLDAFRSH
jgi:hypothetical protein